MSAPECVCGAPVDSDECQTRAHLRGPIANGRGGMRAETLREAAKLMRERAQAATPSPWRDDLQTVVSTAWWVRADGASAAHIASWHPAIACVVADWLEGVAAWMSEGVGYVPNLSDTNWPDMWDDVRTQALAVARAYLGESE